MAETRTMNSEEGPILSKGLRSGVNWYRLFLMLIMACGSYFAWMLKTSMEAHFVPSAVHEEAWKKQVVINEKLSQQVTDLGTRVSVDAEVNGAQSKRLDSVEQDIREQRKLIYERPR